MQGCINCAAWIRTEQMSDIWIQPQVTLLHTEILCDRFCQRSIQSCWLYVHFSLGNVTNFVLCGRGELETSDELFRLCAVNYLWSLGWGILDDGSMEGHIMLKAPKEPEKNRILVSAPRVYWPGHPQVLALPVWAGLHPHSDPKACSCTKAPEALCPHGFVQCLCPGLLSAAVFMALRSLIC